MTSHSSGHDSKSGLFGISLRTPPSNPGAEQALLGAIMTNAKALHAVVGFLTPDHFADALNGRIYRECARRILAGGVADPISLRTWFESDPDAASVDGFTYLAQLITAMVGIINAREYAVVIHDCWRRREIISLGEEMVNRAFAVSEEDQPVTLIASVIDRLDAVAAGAGTERRAVSADEAFAAALSAAQRAAQRNGPAGLSTGMPDVDAALGGLEDQCLYVLAGRPGMGKSALGMNWAYHGAREAKAAAASGKAKRGVLIISLEMSAEQVARRILAAAAQIPLAAFKRGEIQQVDYDRMVEQVSNELSCLPLSIEDCSGLNIGMIRLKARIAKRRHGLGLIVVDHLHIVKPEEADNRNGATAAVGKISNGLKQLAKEFECPVLALAQLNRGVEGRDDKRPTLADLRQAGEIEQDGDAVMFIFRGEYYLPKSSPDRQRGETAEAFARRVAELEDERERLHGKAELIFAKVRDGDPTTVRLNFDGPTTHFSDAV